MERKKLIPYPNNKMKRIARGLVLDYRARVVSLANALGKSIIVKSRSHDNSLVSSNELIYTEWMANQDVDLSDEEYELALEHHYVDNDHHLEHFDHIADMNLQQLSMYLCDVIAQVSYENCTDDTDFIDKVDKKLEELCSRDHTLGMILKNTARTMLQDNTSIIRGVYRLK